MAKVKKAKREIAPGGLLKAVIRPGQGTNRPKDGDQVGAECSKNYSYDLFWFLFFPVSDSVELELGFDTGHANLQFCKLLNRWRHIPFLFLSPNFLSSCLSSRRFLRWPGRCQMHMNYSTFWLFFFLICLFLWSLSWNLTWGHSFLQFCKLITSTKTHRIPIPMFSISMFVSSFSCSSLKSLTFLFICWWHVSTFFFVFVVPVSDSVKLEVGFEMGHACLRFYNRVELTKAHCQPMADYISLHHTYRRGCGCGVLEIRFWRSELEFYLTLHFIIQA